MLSLRDRILPPYTQRVNDTRHVISKVLLWTGLIIFAMLLGFFLAVSQQYGILLAAVPLALLFGLALWLAPDVDPHLDGILIKLTLFLLGVSLIWPNYIAFNLPGLPWISFRRLMLFVLVALFGFQLASSARTRGETAEVLTSCKPLLYGLLGFAIIQTLMIPVGGFDTMSRWVHYNLNWTFGLILCAWVFRHPGTLMTFNRIIIVGAALTSIVVIPEWRSQQVPWAFSIPAFLAVDPEVLGALQRSQARFIDGLYRARSIHLNSLYYAEYIAVVTPFVVFAILQARKAWHAAAGMALWALLFFGAWATNARSAFVGLIVATVGVIGLWAWNRYQTKKEERDMLAPALVWLYIGGAAVLATAILTVHRIRVRVLGGSQHQFSNAGREEQWDRTFDQLLRNPFGHGIDQATETVGSFNPGKGIWTLDAYPINLLIDYGVLGFLFFVGMLVAAIVISLRTYFRATDADQRLAAPIAVAIGAFMLNRTILSAEVMQFFIYSLVGAALALWWRQNQEIAARAPAPEPPPSPLYPLPPAPRGRPAAALAHTAAR
jgi:hypothetical protein